MNIYLKNDTERLINSLNDLVANKNNRNVKELMENVNNAFYYLTKYDLSKLSQEELNILNDACQNLKLVKLGACKILKASLSIDILGLLVTLSIVNGKDFFTIGAFLYFGYQIYIDTIGNSMYSVPARELKHLAIRADQIMKEIEVAKEQKIKIKDVVVEEKEDIKELVSENKENELDICNMFLSNINTLSDEEKVNSFRYLMNEINGYININPTLKYYFGNKVAECYYEVLNSINNSSLIISFVDSFFIDYLVQYGYSMLDCLGETLEVIRFRNFLYRNRNSFTNLENLKYISEFLIKNKEYKLVLRKEKT